jgi:hypothetical protein
VVGAVEAALTPLAVSAVAVMERLTALPPLTVLLILVVALVVAVGSLVVLVHRTAVAGLLLSVP